VVRCLDTAGGAVGAAPRACRAATGYAAPVVAAPGSDTRPPPPAPRPATTRATARACPRTVHPLPMAADSPRSVAHSPGSPAPRRWGRGLPPLSADFPATQQARHVGARRPTGGTFRGHPPPANRPVAVCGGTPGRSAWGRALRPGVVPLVAYDNPARWSSGSYKRVFDPILPSQARKMGPLHSKTRLLPASRP